MMQRALITRGASARADFRPTVRQATSSRDGIGLPVKIQATDSGRPLGPIGRSPERQSKNGGKDNG